MSNLVVRFTLQHICVTAKIQLKEQTKDNPLMVFWKTLKSQMFVPFSCKVIYTLI